MRDKEKLFTSLQIKRLVDALSTLEKTDREEILNHSDSSGWNILMIALRNKSKQLNENVIHAIINISSDCYSVLKHTVNTTNWNPLMMALDNPSDTLTSRQIKRVVDISTAESNTFRNNIIKQTTSHCLKRISKTL